MAHPDTHGVPLASALNCLQEVELEFLQKENQKCMEQ